MTDHPGGIILVLPTKPSREQIKSIFLLKFPNLEKDFMIEERLIDESQIYHDFMVGIVSKILLCHAYLWVK